MLREFEQEEREYREYQRSVTREAVWLLLAVFVFTPVATLVLLRILL